MKNIEIDLEEPIFTISAAAKILNISIPTMRMYEREGLFIPFKKSTHQRLYSKADIERIACIRQSINEFKISINGIKSIYSLIPCWSILKCSREKREECEAFKCHGKPCWSCFHESAADKKLECRNCEVYRK